MSAAARHEAAHLCALALRGLRLGYLPHRRSFAQTVRRVMRDGRPVVHAEGVNLRYAAMAALGLARCTSAEQAEVLDGLELAGLIESMRRSALDETDLGAVALTAWAAAEAGGQLTDELAARLSTRLEAGAPLATVEIAWSLTAGLAMLRLMPGSASAQHVVGAAMRMLVISHGEHGIHPHTSPAGAAGRLRAHVGSFADQVYPLQAFARLAEATGDREHLARAERTARRLCELQGDAGQWWWHYDARTGEVVERFPVYSVHQHAMAPMVLFDLLAAGGTDHLASLERGLAWIARPPEASEPLVDEGHGLIWRKVGRKEPAKAARTASAVTTALHPGWHLPGIDRAFPPGPVDHECRPYELGWLLYAWRPVLGAVSDPEEDPT